MSQTQRVASPRNSLTTVLVQDKGIATIMKIYLTYCLMSIHSVSMDVNSVYNRMGGSGRRVHRISVDHSSWTCKDK